MKARAEYSGILDRSRLSFRDNRELEAYYEEKYRAGGYEGGCVRFGLNISQRYHEARHRSALGFVSPRPGQVILDAGCGTGALAAQIAAQGAQVEAIDIAANAFARQFATIPNLRFQKMNIEQLGFDAGAFDQIVCVEALEHVIDPQRVLSEFRRTLKPGGRLVITYPTINRTLVQRMHRALHVGRPLGISEHLNEWSYAELITRIEAAGFGFERAEGLVFDFGVLGALKQVSRFFAVGLTDLALKIRACPRNSLFVSALFQRRG